MLDKPVDEIIYGEDGRVCGVKSGDDVAKVCGGWRLGLCFVLFFWGGTEGWVLGASGISIFIVQSDCVDG